MSPRASCPTKPGVEDSGCRRGGRGEEADDSLGFREVPEDFRESTTGSITQGKSRFGWSGDDDSDFR
jgi:hypothetical protein